MMRPCCPAWLDDAGLSVGAFRVYLHVLRRSGGGKRWCTAKTTSMGEVCGMRRQTVAGHLKTLVEGGLLEEVGEARSRKWRPLFEGGSEGESKGESKGESEGGSVRFRPTECAVEAHSSVRLRPTEEERVDGRGPLSVRLRPTKCSIEAHKGRKEREKKKGDEESNEDEAGNSESDSEVSPSQILSSWGKLGNARGSLEAISDSLERGASAAEMLAGTRRIWAVVLDCGAKHNKYTKWSLAFFRGECWREDAEDWRAKFAGDARSGMVAAKVLAEEAEDHGDWY